MYRENAKDKDRHVYNYDNIISSEYRVREYEIIIFNVEKTVVSRRILV